MIGATREKWGTTETHLECCNGNELIINPVDFIRSLFGIGQILPGKFFLGLAMEVKYRDKMV